MRSSSGIRVDNFNKYKEQERNANNLLGLILFDESQVRLGFFSSCGFKVNVLFHRRL